MNRSLIVLLISLLFFTACKREYALVQPAKPDFFVQKQRNNVQDEIERSTFFIRDNITEQTETIGINEALTQPSTESTNEALQDFATQKPYFDNRKGKQKQIKKRPAANFLTKVFPKQQVKESPKKSLKKKRKPIKRWGTMIPTGFVFLGIAILLSLININGLALLFGVASILFLFLGFRKLLRKKRRREIFR